MSQEHNIALRTCKCGKSFLSHQNFTWMDGICDDCINIRIIMSKQIRNNATQIKKKKLCQNKKS